MQTFTPLWNELMSIAILIMLGCIVVLIFALLFPEFSFSKKILAFTQKYVLAIGFFISFGALCASLVYSNVIGYAPCLLCWYGRVAFYPQVVLYGVALRKKDFSVLTYSLWLTTIGTIIAAYHYTTESIGYSPLPCSANGVSCLTRYVYEFGFISIPFMELVPFVLLLIIVLIARKAYKTKVSA